MDDAVSGADDYSSLSEVEIVRREAAKATLPEPLGEEVKPFGDERDTEVARHLTALAHADDRARSQAPSGPALFTDIANSTIPVDDAVSGADDYSSLSEVEIVRREAAKATLPEPLGEPSLGETLDDVALFLSRFLCFESAAQSVAVSLWIVGTYVFDVFDVTPYLHIKSPEKRSGKSLLLEVLEMLCRRPILASNISPAALYRIVDRGHRSDDDVPPTLLLDEVDAVFPKGRSNDPQKEDLRGLLNAGYRKSGRVYRSNQRGGIEEFSAFSPKALAGIGDLPDTLSDRCIVIALQRKPRSVVVERFRRRLIEPEAAELSKRITAATSGLPVVLRNMFPELPDDINDREQDTWELLMAIADHAGGEWPDAARAAASAIAGATADDAESIGQRLLSDLSTVWAVDEPAIGSKALCGRLHDLEEAPWKDWYGRSFNERDLATRLKPFGVSSTDVKWLGTTLKGYRRDDLYPVWLRYIQATGATEATPQPQQGESQNSQGQPKGNLGNRELPQLPPAEPGATTETPSAAGDIALVAPVAPYSDTDTVDDLPSPW
jgi:hypothetical protein